MEWDLGQKALPFYFDHKVADEMSWGSQDVGAEFSWMLAGLHLPIDMNGDNDIDLSGTVFIKGCGKSQGNLECNLGPADHKPCPSRPQWKLKW